MYNINLEASAEYTRENVNRIIGAALLLEQQLITVGVNPVVSEIIHNACNLLTQNINLSYLYGDGLYADSKELIDCSAVLDRIIEESALILVGKNRDISFKSEVLRGSVRIDPKAFTVVIMNLLQNALLYSPDAGTVAVALKNSGKAAVITIKNKKGGGNPEPARSGLGIPLSKKIVEWHGGELEIADGKSSFVSKITLPLIKAESTFELNSAFFDYSDYVSERFKPVNLFLEEVACAACGEKL